MDNLKNEIILFENQGVKLEVNLKEETVWLTQKQMAELFQKDSNTINEHINNIFNEGELMKILLPEFPVKVQEEEDQRYII